MTPNCTKGTNIGVASWMSETFLVLTPKPIVSARMPSERPLFILQKSENDKLK